MPCIAILISTSKNPVPSYYCLYSLYNKIRNKGKIVSAGYWWGEREGAEWVVREGVGAVGRNEPSLVCTYE
jgi:hypothetical protein